MAVPVRTCRRLSGGRNRSDWDGDQCDGAVRWRERRGHRGRFRAAAVSDHNPVRPGWLCGGCGHAWPCRTRKAQLLAEYDGARASLVVLMRAYFCDAAQEVTGARADDLHARFLGWLGPSRRGGSAPSARHAAQDRLPEG